LLRNVNKITLTYYTQKSRKKGVLTMDNFEAANAPQRQPEMVVSKCWECGKEKECIEYIVCCTGTKFYTCPECEKKIQEEG